MEISGRFAAETVNGQQLQTIPSAAFSFFLWTVTKMANTFTLRSLRLRERLLLVAAMPR